MTREEKYIQALKALGIYQPAFDSTIHDLALLEREQARTRKAWKATAEPGSAPSSLDKHYAMILEQGKRIDALRDALGLTPKALRRIKYSLIQERPAAPAAPAKLTVLELVRARKDA